MGNSFDKILKKGQDAASKTDPVEIWKNLIGVVLHNLQLLNDSYHKKDMHHVAIKPIKCNICGSASYIAAVRDISNPSQVMKFHIASWKSISEDVYECPLCRKD